MDRFIENYPKVAVSLFAGLFGFTGVLCMFILASNTSAMNKQSDKIDTMLCLVNENSTGVQVNKTNIANNRKDIDKLE